MIIHKLQLDEGEHSYEFPVGAKILSAEMQNSYTVLWYLFDPDLQNKYTGKRNETEKRHILVTVTEVRIENHGELHHIATVMNSTGTYVEHVFERRTKYL